MRDLVELLEGNDYLDENKGDTEYQLFSEEYVSYIIQKYVSDEKDSIILKAIYGILEDLASYGKYVPKNNSYQPKIPKMLYCKYLKIRLCFWCIV